MSGLMDAAVVDAAVNDDAPAEIDTAAAGDGGGGAAGAGDAGAPSGDAGVPSVSRSALLRAFGECALETARHFLARASELESAAIALRDTSGPASQQTEAAREAYRKALDAWQVAEVMQFGPAAQVVHPGGRDLRENIYSWPLVGRCPVETEIVSRGYEASAFSTMAASNRRTLTALEYLLFYEGADTACPASSPIVASGSWAALSTDEIAARKRAYAAVVASDVRSRAMELVAAWAPLEGNFVRSLETAGPGNAVYPTSRAAFNAVSDALFYIEITAKDMKLARPLGLDAYCGLEPTCPEALESPVARRAKANLAANLQGFGRIALGCGPDFAGLGFDDLLVELGQADLARRIRDAVSTGTARLAAIEEPDLAEALEKDRPSVADAYAAFRVITNILKMELVGVLDLELPKEVKSDND